MGKLIKHYLDKGYLLNSKSKNGGKGIRWHIFSANGPKYPENQDISYRIETIYTFNEIIKNKDNLNLEWIYMTGQPIFGEKTGRKVNLKKPIKIMVSRFFPDEEQYIEIDSIHELNQRKLKYLCEE